jgi:hypothetical protein
MNEQPEVQAARLQYRQGRAHVSVVTVGSTGSDDWGCLYAVPHVINRGSAAERICDRVEGVAQETYRRSSGGVTNRLRLAVRNANKYLYLRNLVRGEEQALIAAVACVAIRGTDAYACGVGPHSILVLSRGGVRSLGNGTSQASRESGEGWSSNGHALGRRAKLSDPSFLYRQLRPGDLLMIVAGDDVGVFRQAADRLALTLDGRDIEEAATGLGELVGPRADGAAMLVRVLSDPAWPADVCKVAGTKMPEERSASPRVLSSLRRPRKRFRPTDRPSWPSGESVISPGDDLVSRCEPDRPLGRARRTRRARASLREGPADTGSRAQRFMEDGTERFRLAGTLIVSLLLALRAGLLWVLTSCAGVFRHSWRWIRQHRLLERLLGGGRLALVGLWTGIKGLVTGVLPERQRPTTTYAASARPMARAKVLGFHPSQKSRAAIGVLIMLFVFALVAASAVRVKARLEQADIETLVSEVEESLTLVDRQGDREAKMAALAEAQELIEQAPASQRDAAELHQLSVELESRWDGLSGVVRLPFAAEQGLAGIGQAPHMVAVHRDEVYVLGEAGQRLYKYALDQQGHILASADPWTWDFSAGEEMESDARILDIEWVEAANGRLTPALAMLTSEGSILELRADGSIRTLDVAETSRWQSPLALATYQGNLYVLDPEYGNVLKYTPDGDDYQNAPIDYVEGGVDIRWEQVVDIAIDGFVYLLLSDGSVMKFAGGQTQPFPQEGLYPALQHPTGLFASPECQSVFVADGEEGRIVEFSKDGQFVRQYRAALQGPEGIDGLGTFTIDPARGRMLVGTPSGVLGTDLPSLQPREEQ